jgi:hypothetical protein
MTTSKTFLKMILLIFLLTAFAAPSMELEHNILSKTTLLTNNTQQPWYVSSMTPDERCGSSSDDQWIFFADGTFEFNHGTVTEDKPNECSDFVNFTGTWTLTNNESILTVVGTKEKGNASNNFSVTMLNGTISVLDEQRLVVVTTISPTEQYTIEFKKR